MAEPMTPDELVAALTRWRVPFRRTDGWRTRNRNHAGPWGPMHGLVVHHTADDALDAADLRLVTRGRRDLPGPLAQFGCDDEGTVWLVGWGRANHAGGGDPGVLRAVIGESYGDYPPRPREHEGSPGSTDGNRSFYGVETFYSGAEPPTAAARRSLVLLSAAICDHHGWSAKSVIGHKEWSDQKTDPGHVDMKVFRSTVAQQLRHGPPTGEGIDVYLRRARRRLQAAYDDLVIAERNLGWAVDEGARVRAIRDRTRTKALSLKQDAARLDGRTS